MTSPMTSPSQILNTVNTPSSASPTSPCLSPPLSSSAAIPLTVNCPSVLPQPQPVVRKQPPTDLYYGHEETAKICACFIRYVFNRPPGSNPPCKYIAQSVV